MLTIRGKAIGRKNPLFADFSVPPPALSDGCCTLRELIEAVVRHEVREFGDRQRERQFVRALTAREIDAGLEAGKVDSGGREADVPEVDVEVAVANALQAFDDRLYLIIVDDNEKQDLDAQILVQPDSQLTFVRLSLLAGG